MFSGKTTELLRRLERYILAGYTYCAMKPEIDSRNQIASIRTIRQTVKLDPIPVSRLTNISVDKDVVVLDEAQFFNEELISFAQGCRDQGKILLISGLDMDYCRKPFGYMGDIMAIADKVTKLTAICACGNNAIYSKKIGGDMTQQVEIGDEKYIPVCLGCYNKSLK